MNPNNQASMGPFHSRGKEDHTTTRADPAHPTPLTPTTPEGPRPDERVLHLVTPCFLIPEPPDPELDYYCDGTLTLKTVGVALH